MGMKLKENKKGGSVPGSVVVSKEVSKSALSSIMQAAGCVASIQRVAESRKHTVYVTDWGFEPT